LCKQDLNACYSSKLHIVVLMNSVELHLQPPRGGRQVAQNKFPHLAHFRTTHGRASFWNILLSSLSPAVSMRPQVAQRSPFQFILLIVDRNSPIAKPPNISRTLCNGTTQTLAFYNAFMRSVFQTSFSFQATRNLYASNQHHIEHYF